MCFLFFSDCGERMTLRRSLRPKIRNPPRMSFHALSRQLGVGVEVELEEQVIIDREICKKMNLQIRFMRKLSLYQKVHRVQRQYLQPYHDCSLYFSRELRICQFRVYSMF